MLGEDVNRRDLLAIGGMALASSGLGATAYAAHHEGGHAKNPWAAVVEAAADCVGKGDVCVAHCAEMLAQGKKDMGECNKKAHQMLAMCKAMRSLAAQQSPLAKDIAQACIKACEECAEACKPHAKMHADCKACMDACNECAKACRAAFA